jgi:tRNA 2-thiouridine synthesizing protein A
MIPAHDFDIDARGLNCPLPVLRAKQAIGHMERGKVLRVRASDPGSVKDFDAFCRQSGNERVSFEESDGEYTFYLRKT